MKLATAIVELHRSRGEQFGNRGPCPSSSRAGRATGTTAASKQISRWFLEDARVADHQSPLFSECPDTIVVSVSHRRTVEQHHRQHLQLLGEGAWRVGPVGDLPPTVV